MGNDKIANYIEDKYYNEIYAAVEAEYKNQASILDMHSYKVPYPESAWLKQIVVTNVHFKDDLSSEITQFSLRVVGVFEVSATSEDYYVIDDVFKDFIVNGTCKIDDGLKNVEIRTAEYNLHHYTPDNQSLSDMMLPYIDDMDEEEVDGLIINDKCKTLAKKVKEIIDTKSSFADWLNNQNVRADLKLDIKICLVKNGYPPQYSPEVFTKVMEQVENFEENSND